MGKVKVIVGILVVLVVIIAGALFFLVQNLDDLVKKAIEKYGSEAAGTAVRVEAVHIDLRAGRGELKGLSLANPPGYSGQKLFTLGEIAVDLDTQSLTAEVPVIEEIKVGQTTFRYEINAQGKDNLSVLQANLKTATGGAKQQAAPKADQGATEPVRLKINRLAIAGGEGTLDLSQVGQKELKATVPGVTLNNLGGKNGLTPNQIAAVVLDALIENLKKTAAKQGVEQLLKKELDAQTGEAQKKIDEKLGEGTSETLKGLLGK